MKMHRSLALTAAALAVLGGFGCKKFSKDKSPLVANVGGEKITETQFKSLAKSLAQDDKKVEDLMKNTAQRNQFLESLAMQKALIRFGKLEGLDKDQRAQTMVEQAMARAYFQVLVDRRLSKAEPTDAQLRPIYDDLVAQRKAAGQDKGLPPFEDPKVKGYLAGAWKQKQEQEISEAVLKEVRLKVPITYGEGYKPLPMPGMMQQQ